MNNRIISEKELDMPMYNPAEVGRLVGISNNRVRRWLQGYSYGHGHLKRHKGPVIKSSSSDYSGYASFLDLVDLLFVKRFLDHGLSLQKLRKALDEAAEILGTSHFARERFFTDGNKVYLEVKSQGRAILELLSGGQWVIPQVIRDLACQIEFDQASELARRWYPFGPEGLIVLDPFVSFGRPTITGKGIATLNIYDFYAAEGRDTKATSQWLGLNDDEVVAAVEFEEQLAA